MRRLPYRILLVSLLAGVGTYIACANWLQPSPASEIAAPWKASHPIHRQNSLVFAPRDVVLAFSGLEADGKADQNWVFKAANSQALAGPTPKNCAFSPKGDAFALFDSNTLQV